MKQEQEAEDSGLHWKDFAEYVTRQQTLDREERAEWRKIWMAELQADDKKRADELQAGKEKRADESHIQIARIEVAKEQAKIEADKELALKQLELPCSGSTHRNKDAKSPKLPSCIYEKDELDSYLVSFERYAENASWEKNTWAIKLSAVLTERAMDIYTRMSGTEAND